MYTLADERVMFLDLAVAQQINALGVNVREKFFICKHSGTGKGADWTVWLSSETEAARMSKAISAMIVRMSVVHTREADMVQDIALSSPKSARN